MGSRRCDIAIGYQRHSLRSLKAPQPFTLMRWTIAIGNRQYPMHNNKAPKSYPRCDAISQSAIGDTLFMHIVMPIHPDAMRFRYRRSGFQNCQHKDLSVLDARLWYSADFKKVVKWRDIMIHSYLKLDLLSNHSPALNRQIVYNTLKWAIRPNNGIMSI